MGPVIICRSTPMRWRNSVKANVCRIVSEKEICSMEMGIIGLGRMGGNMAERLVKGGHRVVGCDPSPEAQERVRAVGVETAGSIAELVGKLQQSPRAVWSMVKSGDVTEKV